MSFLSVLGNIGKAALGFVPGVGPVLGAIGNVASGAAQGSANQRVAEAPGQIGAYRANLEGQQLQDRRAALASLLGGGLGDVSISRPAGSTIPTFGIRGGLRPSAMNQQALLEQLSKQVPGLEMPQAGVGEKILGGVGLGGSLLGALGSLGGPKPGGPYGTPPFMPDPRMAMPMPPPPRRLG